MKVCECIQTTKENNFVVIVDAVAVVVVRLIIIYVREKERELIHSLQFSFFFFANIERFFAIVSYSYEINSFD